MDDLDKLSPVCKFYLYMSMLFAFVGLLLANISNSSIATKVVYGCLIASGAFILLLLVRVIREQFPPKEKKEQNKTQKEEKTTKKTNIMKKNSFVVIDFEHLHPAYETACEVGVVRVVDGLITGRYYATIKPPQSLCIGRDNADIIGLNEEMLSNSPEFPQVYAELCSFIGQLPLVAHHSTTEKLVLQRCCYFYNLDEILLKNGLIDTCVLSGNMSLVNACVKYGISLTEHHNPMQDAEATACLYLKLIGEEHITVVRGERMGKSSLSCYKKESESFDKSILVPLEDDAVTNKNTPFYGKVKTVVTGVFDAYPDRNALKASLKDLGADIDTSVSKNTKILVVGNSNVGPSKIAKANEYGIRIIKEKELYQWVEKQDINL